MRWMVLPLPQKWQRHRLHARQLRSQPFGLRMRNAGLPPDRRIEFGVGIHLGDVVEEAGGWQRMLPLET
jgi:class 3 adenylate cyclase